MPLSKSEIEAEVDRLGPFHHGIDLPFGLSTQTDKTVRGKGERNRMPDLLAAAWPATRDLLGGSLEGRSVLDVGCNCGGFSVHAARDGAERVLGIDVVDRYVDQGQFVKRALELDALEFRAMSIEEIDSDRVGSFDLTLCFGLLFHLENPVLSMRKLASVTEHAIVVDTNIARGKGSSWRMNFVGPANPGNPSTSLWRGEEARIQFMPTARAVEKLLQFLGFTEVRRLDPHPEQAWRRYHNGTRATFIGTR